MHKNGSGAGLLRYVIKDLVLWRNKYFISRHSKDTLIKLPQLELMEIFEGAVKNKTLKHLMGTKMI